MAVERPSPDLGHVHRDADRAARRHHDHMLARPGVARAVLQVHPEPMQMDGMVHHGLVLEDQAYRLALGKVHHGFFGILAVVERPEEPVHVPRQPELDRTIGRIERIAAVEALQIGITQHLGPCRRIERRHVHEPREIGTARGRGRHGMAHFRVIHVRIHARHGPVAAAMPHVGRPEQARWPQHRQGAGHALTRGERGAGGAAPVERLCLDRVGAVLARLDDHVVGLADTDAELVDLDRLHVLAVGLHDPQLQAGNAGIEDRHGRAVDEAQPYLLAGLEERGPVVGRAAAVHQEGVAGDVGEIGRIHAHLAPHQAVGDDRLALLGRLRRLQVFHQPRQGTLAVVEVAGLLLQLAQDGVGRHRMLVAQHHHVVARHLVALAFGGLDDDRRVHAGLLLAAGMAMVPVGAGLPDLEAVGEGFARLDAAETHHRHAVHVERQQDAVPMEGGVLLEAIGDIHRHLLAFLPAQRRAGDLAVDREDVARLAVDLRRRAVDHEVVGAGHRRQRCRNRQRERADEGASEQHGASPCLKGNRRERFRPGEAVDPA